MVQATRWAQDNRLAPNNPNQKLRWYPTFPSGGGGYSTFGWSPQPLGDQFKMTGSPAGFMTSGGLSGLAAILPSASGAAKVFGAVVGVAGGLWLARANLRR